MLALNVTLAKSLRQKYKNVEASKDIHADCGSNTLANDEPLCATLKCSVTVTVVTLEMINKVHNLVKADRRV